MRGDLSVIGLQFTRPRKIAASATRFEAGEPIVSTITMSSGVASSNTWTIAAADFVVLGTNTLGGVATKGALPYKTGTLVAQTVICACPVPMAGILRGRAQVVASVDTAAELLLILNDTALVDYNSTGASDGGELYTIIETATSDTSGFAIVDGNPAKGSLDVEAYATIYRIDQDVT
jgi:hypothetical protein